jgi:hypothetical protein
MTDHEVWTFLRDKFQEAADKGLSEISAIHTWTNDEGICDALDSCFGADFITYEQRKHLKEQLKKHKPATTHSCYWWPTTPDGYRLRVAILEKLMAETAPPKPHASELEAWQYIRNVFAEAAINDWQCVKLDGRHQTSSAGICDVIARMASFTVSLPSLKISSATEDAMSKRLAKYEPVGNPHSYWWPTNGAGHTIRVAVLDKLIAEVSPPPVVSPYGQMVCSF